MAKVRFRCRAPRFITKALTVFVVVRGLATVADKNDKDTSAACIFTRRFYELNFWYEKKKSTTGTVIFVARIGHARNRSNRAVTSSP